MKVVLENVVPTQQGKRGLGNYFQNLVTALSEQDHTTEYVLFNYLYTDFEAKKRGVFSIDRPNFSSCIRRAPQRLVESLEWRWSVPVIDWMLPKNTGVYHAVESRLPHLSPRIKTVVTICDLLHEKKPGWFEGSSTLQLRDACRRADKLIAISQFTKDDIRRYYGVAEDKIEVILCGVDHAIFRPITDPARLDDVRTRYRLPERFLLSTGPFEPRRNMEGLLEVLASLSSSTAAKDLFLVLTGGNNFYTERVRKRTAELGLEKKVVFPGYIPEADLPAFYRLAELFVYPSFHEGFGLGPLEALACGAPVIASGVSAIPEVVGDAAVLIDPSNPTEMKAAILRLLEDRSARAELSSKGPPRAKTFTWEAAAEKTRKIYRELAEAGA